MFSFKRETGKSYKLKSKSRLNVAIGRDGPWTDLSLLLTRPDEIFLTPEDEKIKNLVIFRGNFPNLNPNQRWLTRPGPSNKIAPDPSLAIRVFE